MGKESRADRIAYLIYQSYSGNLTEDETVEMNAWIDESEKNRQLFDQLSDEEAMGHFILFNTRMELEQRVVRRYTIAFLSRKWGRYAVAALILLLVVGGILVHRLTLRGNGMQSDLPQRIINDVAPGKLAARLILAGGKEIELNKARFGLVAQQGVANIYNENGEIRYTVQGNTGEEVLYNVLETTTGQTYPLILSDGTKVWLNSQSSLRYPAIFSSDTRKVEVKGEAYFEVAKNAEKPFIVKINTPSGDKDEVRVLGTQFNINAYPDEPVVQTTLVEGKVQVFTTDRQEPKTINLSPGQQVQLSSNGPQVVNNADIYAVTAWKNNDFNFQSYNLKTIMRQLSRWYGVEVVYQGNIPDLILGSGTISRRRNLSDVLKVLEENDFAFKIEGKKVIVMPRTNTSHMKSG